MMKSSLSKAALYYLNIYFLTITEISRITLSYI